MDKIFTSLNNDFHILTGSETALIKWPMLQLCIENGVHLKHTHFLFSLIIELDIDFSKMYLKRKERYKDYPSKNLRLDQSGLVLLNIFIMMGKNYNATIKQHVSSVNDLLLLFQLLQDSAIQTVDGNLSFSADRALVDAELALIQNVSDQVNDAKAQVDAQVS